MEVGRESWVDGWGEGEWEREEREDERRRAGRAERGKHEKERAGSKRTGEITRACHVTRSTLTNTIRGSAAKPPFRPVHKSASSTSPGPRGLQAPQDNICKPFIKPSHHHLAPGAAAYGQLLHPTYGRPSSSGYGDNGKNKRRNGRRSHRPFCASSAQPAQRRCRAVAPPDNVMQREHGFPRGLQRTLGSATRLFKFARRAATHVR